MKSLTAQTTNQPITKLTLTRTRPLAFMAVALLPLAAFALTSSVSAQGQVSLASSVRRALTNGADTSNARATLQKARANLVAVRSDPTSIITTLTQAQHEAKLQLVNLQNTKLNVAREVVGQYANTYEASAAIALKKSQVELDERTLQIAKARLKARVATQLDVSRAETALDNSRQELADAKAKLPVAQAQLLRMLGLSTGQKLLLKAPAQPPQLNASLNSLQTGLESRQPALVQASQAVAFAKLQVKISDNDYTPARTLQDAKVALANAERSYEDAKKSALTAVRDAYRAVQDTQKRVNIAQQQQKNAQTSLNQAKVRLKAGTAAAIDVQQAEVQSQQASFGVEQAQNGLWKALAALGSAAAKDLTGLVK